jgi:hypothetical protein
MERATEATNTPMSEDLDKNLRYLVPVAAMPIDTEPDSVHLAVYEWLPTFEAWATGMSLCGNSMRQGALPKGTAVTCEACVGWRAKYERYLAPGYRPEDDDPDVLRRRAETAEQQVRQAQALVAKWQRIAADREGATVLVSVAAGVLKATLDGFNDLLAEEGR